MNRSINNLSVGVLVWLVLGGGAWGQAAESPDSAQAKARLSAVRERITALTTRLTTDLDQRDALSARLREVEMGITANRRRLDGLHAALLAVDRQRTDLRSEQARIEKLLVLQRRALAAQVRDAYMIGPQEQIKLLLNQTDPSDIGRMMTYYGYFARERGGKIIEIRAQVTRAQELIGQIDESTTELERLQAEAAKETADLQHARAERAGALLAVSRQVTSGTQELAQLKREEQAVEALVADLALVLQEFPVDTRESFDTLRGRLPWPVPGRMSPHVAEARGLNGVQIDAARGAKVRAPYFGRVVYADWLQGLGLLLIIGHGGNFMTLYGHAEVLYKSVGDWVSPGDVIAAMSDTAGATPQLYFEIRNGRKAVDPKSWLKSAP